MVINAEFIINNEYISCDDYLGYKYIHDYKVTKKSKLELQFKGGDLNLCVWDKHTKKIEYIKIPNNSETNTKYILFTFPKKFYNHNIAFYIYIKYPPRLLFKKKWCKNDKISKTLRKQGIPSYINYGKSLSFFLNAHIILCPGGDVEFITPKIKYNLTDLEKTQILIDLELLLKEQKENKEFLSITKNFRKELLENIT